MASLTYYGHAAFRIDTGRHKVLFDPYLTGNPHATVKAESVECDAILLSHGHSDHLGDTVAISRRTGAPVVTTYELAGFLAEKGVSVHRMHIGGKYEFEFGTVKLTPAFHGGGVEGAPGVYCTPCGFLLKSEGHTVYYPGDTALTIEFDLIGRLNHIDTVLLPIGDNFTMGPEDALEAVRMLRPKTVVPLHYNTWEVITQDPEAFKRRVEALTPAQVTVVRPGDTVEL
ncbi:metal-dependent hydrolase [bacterium]|nr:metal-dependent hydrolase [bacterium]